MRDNLIIYVSSRNNYDMLKGEIFDIDFEGFEFINVDDCSCEEEIVKGEAYCEEVGYTFLENKSRGVQMATQTLVDFITENRPNCKYIICFQHDVKPISPNFFSRISKLIDSGELDEFGGIGFNVIDRGKYTGKSYARFQAGEKPRGMLGLAHLSVKNNKRRWISPHHNPIAVKHPDKWDKPFSIEFPAWMVVGINLDVWNKVVNAGTMYQFHLWFPSIAMQMNKNNYPLVVFPDLYCLNQQEVKERYGIPANSAHAAKAGDEFHFGEYGSHFQAFRMQFGWQYENVKGTFPRDKYKGTLIDEYFHHKIENGPLNVYEHLKDY